MSDSISDQSAYSADIHSASGDPRVEVLGTELVHPRGTMVILSPQHAKTDAPKLGSFNSAPDLRWGRRAARVAGTAAIGGLAGSLAIAGIFHFVAPGPEMPAYYSALAEGLGRVDHELTALKTSIENSTRATDLQMANLTARMDRTEKAQAEVGSKPANSIERTEHRLAAASGDVTGTVADSRMAAAHPPAIDTKQPPSAPIVDGWVVRDVYHGAALIQGRGGTIEVLPGDNLPGLGRIQQVRRQDGHWVVVTTRGQIVSR